MNLAYPLTMVVAIVAGSYLLRSNQHRLPLTAQQKLGLGLAAFVGSMLSSKIPFLFSDWNDLSSRPVWFANGKTIMFGIVGGYLGVEVAKWFLKVKTKTGDSFAVPVAVSVAIGRVACFIAGCCHGKVTSLPWGVHFQLIDGDSPIVRHPTQLYETVFHLCMAAVLFWLYRRLYLADQKQAWRWDQLFRTHLFKFYLLAYMTYRLISEELRPESEHLFGLTLYQWGTICIIPVFAWLWFGTLVMERGEPADRPTTK